MNKDRKGTDHLQGLTAYYLNQGKVLLALRTYYELLDMYPKEESYYSGYINLLLDPAIISEIGFSGYEQAVHCCDLAINHVREEEKEFFYAKKGSIYLFMIEKNAKWGENNKTAVLNFVEYAMKKYTKNNILLNCATALYKLSGNLERYGDCLDKLLEIHPGDLFLVQEKVMVLEKQGREATAMELFENWIKSNPTSELSRTYLKRISLNKTESERLEDK